MSELIIFDFDGPLVSASKIRIYEAYTEIAKTFSAQCPFRNEDEFRRWWSPDWVENERRLGIAPENQELAHKIFYEIYDKETKLYFWVEEIIKALVVKNYQLAILTNRHRSKTTCVLGELSNYFSEIVGAEDVRRLKPYPDGANLILDRLGQKHQDAFFIGDAHTDILAGKNAGIKTGVVCWGMEKLKFLLPYRPDHIFFTPDDLLRL